MALRRLRWQFDSAQVHSCLSFGEGPGIYLVRKTGSQLRGWDDKKDAYEQKTINQYQKSRV